MLKWIAEMQLIFGGATYGNGKYEVEKIFFSVIKAHENFLIDSLKGDYD